MSFAIPTRLAAFSVAVLVYWLRLRWGIPLVVAVMVRPSLTGYRNYDKADDG